MSLSMKSVMAPPNAVWTPDLTADSMNPLKMSISQSHRLPWKLRSMEPTFIARLVAVRTGRRFDAAMSTPRLALVWETAMSTVPDPLGRWGQMWSLKDQEAEQESAASFSATETPVVLDIDTTPLPIVKLWHVMSSRE